MDLFAPQNFQPGSVVGPGLNWQSDADLGWFKFNQGGDNWICGSGFTMGVRLALGDGSHYGFADFAMLPGSSGPQYQPVRWGYESQPNVPVTVPAPAGLVLLSLGIKGRARRRAR